MKVFLQLFAIAFVVVIASSCRDEFTEEQAIEAAADATEVDADIQRARDLLLDSLSRVGGIIHYTVSVVDAGNAVFESGDGNYRMKGVKAVSGATVSVSQNGEVRSVTTGADGLAVFDDMRVGNVAVNVTVTDFTDVNFIADITPADNYGSTDSNFQDFTRNAATQIPVFPTTGANTATVSGRVTFESDLTNTTAEFPTTNVIATIWAGEDFIDRYIRPEGGGNPNDDYAGRVIRVSYDDASVSGAVAADGTYSLTVPASASGLEMFVVTSDVIADQTLLWETVAADGQVSIAPATLRTLFGPGVRSATPSPFYPYDDDYSGPLAPNAIPTPAAAYVTFSAPAGATGQGTVTVATAQAVIGMSGTIELINVTAEGKDYTQAPVVVIDGDGINAAATANITADGVLGSVTVDNQGQGYTAANTSVSLEFGGDQATLDVTILASVQTEYNGDPVVSDISTLAVGDDFAAIPAPTFTNSDAGTGTGATAIGYGVVSPGTSVTAGGSGYVAKYYVRDDAAQAGTQNERISGPELIIGAPDFPLADPLLDQAAGYVRLQGAVSAIALSNEAIDRNGNKYIMDDGTTPTLPTLSFNPLGATGTVTMSTTDGEVERLNFVAPGGLGVYTERPTVALSGNATAFVNNMRVESFPVSNAGAQYTYADGDGVSITGAATGTVVLSDIVSSAWLRSTGGVGITDGYTGLSVSWESDGTAGEGANIATINGTIVGDNLTGFTVVNGGSGFTSDPVWVLTVASDPDPNVIAGLIQGGFSVASITPGALGTYLSSAEAIVTVDDPTTATSDAGLGFIGAAPVTALASTLLEINSYSYFPGSGYDYTASNTATFTGGGVGATQATAEVVIKTSIASVTASGGVYQTDVDYITFNVNHNVPAIIPAGFGAGDYVGFGTDNDGQVWVTGSVTNYVLENLGDGYSTAPTMTADDTDGGSGATFDVLLNDGGLFMWINAGGSGYVVEDIAGFPLEVDVNYNGNDAPLASFDILGSSGPDPIGWQDGLLSLAVDDGGTGYLADPLVRVEEEPVANPGVYRFEDVTATATAGAVTAVTIVEVRTFNEYPNVTVETWKMGAGIDYALTTSGVVAVNVLTQGEGYTVVPDVVFHGSNTGSGAAATANIVDGKVESITVTAPGSGYTTAPNVVLRIPNTPYNAIGEVTVNAKGVVTGISVTCSGCNIGSGYEAPPTVTITESIAGVGAGATAVATINSNGEVSSVIITNGGSGYVAENMDTERGFDVWPDGPWFISYPGKGRAKDIDLGTGYREDL